MDIFIIVRVFWQPYFAYSRLFTGVYLLYVYVYMHVCLCVFQLSTISNIRLLLCNINFGCWCCCCSFFFVSKQSDMYIFGMIINTYKGVHHIVNFTFENVTREHCDGCALFCSLLLFCSTNFVNVCFLFVQLFSILQKVYCFLFIA